ncbi:YqaI family protein [Priestia megaterium]|uniref:YqaI family protein n=1 Tax=Priestia megaterium TaxID=1404 RepID=UPI003D96B956
MHLEHPEITQVNRTGYVNMVAQSEHVGVDYFGTEILIGDEIVTDDNTGEVVLKDDLEKYLEEEYGFKFTTAE